MRTSIALLSVLLGTTTLAEEAAPKKAPREIHLKEERVEGDTRKAVQIVIPRDPSVKKTVDSTNDHLLEASGRR